MNIQELSALIKHRRSIKPLKMSQEEIHRDELEVLLENATWAPTHGRTEPWHFVVFQGESRQALATELQRAYKAETAEEAFKPAKYEKYGKLPVHVPAVIAICMKRQPSGKIPEVEEIEAVACAVQNMHLSATAMGIGGFWSSPAVVYGPGIHAFLDLQAGDKCLGFFYVGRPEGEWPSSKRSPFSDKVVWRQDEAQGE